MQDEGCFAAELERKRQHCEHAFIRTSLRRDEFRTAKDRLMNGGRILRLYPTAHRFQPSLKTNQVP